MALAWGVSSAEAEGTSLSKGPFSGITPNWDKELPKASRFTILEDFNNEAVRDNETGLVWERSPTAPSFIVWSEAFSICAQREVAARKGWHVPMVEQLTSLFTRSGGGLPIGHPFHIIPPTENFWSATTLVFGAPNSNAAWTVELNGHRSAVPKTLSGASVWCVRGGQAFDGNTR